MLSIEVIIPFRFGCFPLSKEALKQFNYTNRMYSTPIISTFFLC